ncbi:hypothetical protein SAY86_024300 [Trapa natans]|uniref:Trichome birefringence-like N-terminal domain-containing protein n=1 Tax=Trapa natans TaxID=22666 RepID=A0AAN7RE87_TRANT|nr:hypothetical protein SAY86_024300 [Trapa natans]
MPPKLPSPFYPLIVFLALALLFLHSSLLSSPNAQRKDLSRPTPSCDLFNGRWVQDLGKPPRPLYDETCPFHRNAWNCLRNQRDNMGAINSWKWVPRDCVLERIDPPRFLTLMRNRNIGFVGDSLNENFLVAFLCALRTADSEAKKWKRKGAWRGAYFPKFNVTVAYHRAVLLAKYEWKPRQSGPDGEVKGIYRVDVDVPADDWAHIGDFYHVLIFNTGHWWGPDKFPKETPLVFYQEGKPILPAVEMLDGLKAVLQNMAIHIHRAFPNSILKFWRLQSPRHFHGGDWNQNGSCIFNKPLEESEILRPEQLDMWFDPSNDGINKEARLLNGLIKDAIQGSHIRVLDLTHLSEFRADAHPAIWLGKKDAVQVWGQDCMHWCLPGVPDTWVDILAQSIRHSLRN